MSCQQRGGADTDWIGEIWRYLCERLVARFRVQGHDPQRDVVSVNKGNVVEGLAARGREGELG